MIPALCLNPAVLILYNLLFFTTGNPLKESEDCLSNHTPIVAFPTVASVLGCSLGRRQDQGQIEMNKSMPELCHCRL